MKKSFAIILCVLMLLSAGCMLTRRETITPSSGPELNVTDAPATTEVPAETEAPQGQGDLAFDTVTLFGEPIGSDAMKDYDLVLVNFWADWCGPCVRELPELERIHQDFPNVLILGVLSMPNSVEDAKSILKEAGVTYPAFEAVGPFEKLLYTLEAFPTTFFFDRSGNAVGEPVIGSQSYEEWKAIVEELLK